MTQYTGALVRIVAVILVGLSTLSVPHGAVAAALPATSIAVPAAKAAPAITAAPDKAEGESESVEPGSPRASVEAYWQLCKNGRFEDAAYYLEIPAKKRNRAAGLARKLKAVIDSRVELDFDAISPHADGEQSPVVPRGYEQIGQFRGHDRKIESLRLR